MKAEIQYFRELAKRQGRIIQAQTKQGIYIKNAPTEASNTLVNIAPLRNNLRVLIKICLAYNIERPTFCRWQFDTGFPPLAVIWHKEKDGAEWIEILESATSITKELSHDI